MIHIDICPSCEEAGDSKRKLLCDNCGFCIEEHCKDYCEIASLLRQTVRHEPRERRVTNEGKLWYTDTREMRREYEKVSSQNRLQKKSAAAMLALSAYLPTRINLSPVMSIPKPSLPYSKPLSRRIS